GGDDRRSRVARVKEQWASSQLDPVHPPRVDVLVGGRLTPGLVLRGDALHRRLRGELADGTVDLHLLAHLRTADAGRSADVLDRRIAQGRRDIGPGNIELVVRRVRLLLVVVIRDVHLPADLDEVLEVLELLWGILDHRADEIGVEGGEDV